jgi:hypothetical protein
MNSKIKEVIINFIKSLQFNFYKLVVLWLLLITTIVLFIEAERLQEVRLLVLACSNLIVGLAALVKTFDLNDSDGGDDGSDLDC